MSSRSGGRVANHSFVVAGFKLPTHLFWKAQGCIDAAHLKRTCHGVTYLCSVCEYNRTKNSWREPAREQHNIQFFCSNVK